MIRFATDILSFILDCIESHITIAQKQTNRMKIYDSNEFTRINSEHMNIFHGWQRCTISLSSNYFVQCKWNEPNFHTKHDQFRWKRRPMRKKRFTTLCWKIFETCFNATLTYWLCVACMLYIIESTISKFMRLFYTFIILRRYERQYGLYTINL